MEDQDLIVLYHEVEHMLRDNQLGWIADQVDEQIRFGKTTTREVTGLKQMDTNTNMLPNFDLSLNDMKSGRKERIPVIVEFRKKSACFS